MGWFLLTTLVLAVGVLLGRLSVRQPAWLVRAHQRLCDLHWRWISRPGAPLVSRGRPAIDAETLFALWRMMVENPTWGAPRIHGELTKLGYGISQSTVSKYMRAFREGPTPRWRAFLHEHAADTAAIDMLTVKTLTLQTLYAFVVLSLDRRKIVHIEVTDHPTADWLALQLTEAFPWDEAPGFLIRDNDRCYGKRFRQRLRAMGICDRPTMPYSPWQNGYVERLIGSIRRECLDHVIVISASHLRRVLREYADHYNNDRTHLGLAKDSPNGRPVEAVGRLVSRPILGGLHHRYYRIRT